MFALVFSIFTFFCCSTLICKESAHELALKVYTERIEKINKILTSGSSLKTSQYDELRSEILSTISALNAMEKEISEMMAHSTSAEKNQLEKTLSHVEELNIVANNILKIIDKKKIHSKLMNYINITLPLYKTATLKKAYTDGVKVSKDIVKRGYLSLLNIGKNSIIYPYSIYWLVWLSFCIGFVPVAIWLRKKVTHPDIKNTYLNKIKTFLTYVLTGAICPVFIVGGLFYIGYLSNSFLFPMSDIITFYLVIGFVWVAMQATATFINPKDYKWGLVHVDKTTAERRSKRISLFLLFLALRLWANRVNYPIEFSQYLELTTQILLSIQAFFIIRVSHFRQLVKILLGMLSVLAPICIFVGYPLLADLVLSGTLYTIIIYLLFKGITYSLKKTLIYTFKSANSIFTDSETSHKSSELIIYWIHAFFTLILFFVACYGVLLAWGIDHTYLNDMVKRLFFGFKVGSHSISLINIFSAIFVFFLLFLLTRYIQRMLAKHVFPYTNFDAGLRHAFKTTAGYVGFTIAVVLSIKTLGLDLSSILFILGGLSVGIGLGLQPIVTNFISGLVMLLERPIKIGDFVELGGEFGVVKRINVRTTEVENFEKCSVLYPNSQVINAMVKNWTKNDRIKRIEVSVGVAYGSDTKLVENVLLKCAAENDFILKIPSPYVVFTEFGNSSLNFTLRCYLKDLSTTFATGNLLRHEVIAALEKNGITVPFQQTNVHFDQTFIDAISKKQPT